jgi:creatinine amidohydrolase
LCVEAASLAKAAVFLLPTQQIGYSPHHRVFKGYLTLSQDVMFRYVTEVCLCAYENGLSKLLLVNSHGGNQSCLQTVVNELGAVYKKHALLVRYWDLISECANETRKTVPGGMGHAGEFETSLMLHLFPDMVDKTRIFDCPPAQGNEYHAPDMFAKNRVYQYKDFSEYSERGNVGQPRFASAEYGRQIADRAVVELSSLIDFYSENEF